MEKKLNKMLSKFYIRYGDDVREGALTIGTMLFIVMCIWCATEFVEWIGRLQVENQTLKIELREEKTALNAMFAQDALDRKQGELERQLALKKLCERDARACKIMKVKW